MTDPAGSTRHVKITDAEIRRQAEQAGVLQLRDPRYPALLLRFRAKDRARASWHVLRHAGGKSLSCQQGQQKHGGCKSSDVRKFHWYGLLFAHCDTGGQQNAVALRRREKFCAEQRKASGSGCCRTLAFDMRAVTFSCWRI